MCMNAAMRLISKTSMATLVLYSLSSSGGAYRFPKKFEAGSANVKCVVEGCNDSQASNQDIVSFSDDVYRELTHNAALERPLDQALARSEKLPSYEIDGRKVSLFESIGQIC